MSHDVFVSYSSNDKPTADAACATLEARGMRCWVAPRDIVPGMDWSESIIDAILGCRLMILILSGHSNLSEQVKREVATAVGEGKILIPMRIEDVPLSKHMRYFLGTPHWLDALTPPLERHLQVLAATVQRFLAVDEPVAVTAAPVPSVAAAPGPVTGTAVAVANGGAPVPVREAVVGESNPITNSIGMKLVLIPAGEFLMGSPDSDKDALDHEKPQHRVRILQPFSMGVYPVTQGQYRAVTGANPGFFKGSDDLPVENVSLQEAIAFCNRLSEREGLKPYYQFGAGAQSGGEGYRLPTEVEWEYAARAGSTARYSYGDDAGSLGEYAWFRGNSGDKTHLVGQKRPNAFGLFDMHGNVWEWCWDGYDGAYYACSPGVDPDGPSQASDRVIRGGSWHDRPRSARSASRSRRTPEDRSFRLGFRLARAQSGR